MRSIKGEEQQAIKRGKLPFKQKLICVCPEGKEFPWKPHTGQSYHSTSNTFKTITVSHTPPVSLPKTHKKTHPHRHRDRYRYQTHTRRLEQILRFPFAPPSAHLTYLVFNAQTKPHVKKNPHSCANHMSHFNERMPKGISWHQPNDQATARVGKCSTPKLKITKPMLQL